MGRKDSQKIISISKMQFLRCRNSIKSADFQKPFKIILYLILISFFLVMSWEAIKKLFKGDIGIVTTEKESGKFLYPSVTVCPLVISKSSFYNNKSFHQIFNKIKKYSWNAVVEASHGSHEDTNEK